MPLLKLREGEFQLRKIFSLFLNEMLKIRKKVAVLVLVIIMTVGMAGCSGFFKIMSIFETDEWDDYWVESNIEREQELLQEIELYEGTVTGEDEYGLEYFISLKYECQYCYLFGRYLKEHDIKETSYKYSSSVISPFSIAFNIPLTVNSKSEGISKISFPACIAITASSSVEYISVTAPIASESVIITPL